MKMKNKPVSDDIEDICEEFGIEANFIEFVWAMIRETKLHGKVPTGTFLPRTKRECALACLVADLMGETTEVDIRVQTVQ